MLQRAASNTYSWWWASHIRSKQSKWLEQNIQDMEEKVQKVLKIIQEDGDSFAKRAEMYYKKRPELINFVEETYKAYRSLAERYDHISTELQNANNTIASVFPEQVQLSIDEEDRSLPSKFPKKILGVPKNIPEVPQLPRADFTHAMKKSVSRKIPDKATTGTAPKLVVSRAEAMEEIEKLQKQILGLQTEKEFVKSSYETGLAKYWEIEKQIEDMQGRIFILQDEFCEGVVIDDEEARSLMARTALKSCEETLTKLEQKQERLVEETKAEAGRIKDVCDELESIKGESMKTKKEIRNSTEEKQEPEILHETFQKKSESSSSLTVAEMAAKIDDIVNKVIGLETAVLMHNALVESLRIEIDELKALIRALKEEKETPINRNIDASDKIEEIEEKYGEIVDLKQTVENQNDRIQLHFKEAHFDLRRMSEKLSGVKPKKGPEQSSSSSMADHQGEAELIGDFKQSDQKENSLLEDIKEVAEILPLDYRSENVGASAKRHPEEGRRSSGNKSPTCLPEINKDLKRDEEDEKKTPRQTIGELLNIQVGGTQKNGSEDKAKILLSQFSRNAEDDEPVDGFERKQHIKELKISNAMKDEEIKSLRQKLRHMNRRFNENRVLQDFKPNVLDISDGSITLVADVKNGDSNLVQTNQPSPTSVMEEKLRARIDELGEESLDFWLKCSTTFPEIQRFETEIQDLHAEISKLEEKGIKLERTSSMKYPLNFIARPLYKHLREIQAALVVWVQKNAALKNEQQSRLSSLCNLEEDIAGTLRENPENDSFKLTSHEAAKFQGEVWSMKQENKKVADELRAGNARVMKFQLDVEKTLAKLDEEFQLSESKKQQSPRMSHSLSRHRVPLRLFIFGDKPKKQMSSLFSCMSPSMHRKYHALSKGS